MLRGVGQRSPTETLFALMAAFVEQRTWSQADLARKLSTRTETIRKQLGELQHAGFKLEREEDHPHVYWSVPKNWFPGMLAFKRDEVPELLRLIGRAPNGKLRERIQSLVVERLGHFGDAARFDVDAVRTRGVDGEDERTLSLLEDAVAQKVVAKIRYFTASRRDEGHRAVSVHRIDLGPNAQFVATCHRSGSLKRFRVSNVSSVMLEPNEAFRPTTGEELARFDEESVAGFRGAGPAVRTEFVVREPEATWVSRTLPDARIVATPEPGGMRFSITTTAVEQIARYVVGLGAVARAETPELHARVLELARGALHQATDDATPASGTPASGTPAKKVVTKKAAPPKKPVARPKMAPAKKRAARSR